MIAADHDLMSEIMIRSNHESNNYIHANTRAVYFYSSCTYTTDMHQQHKVSGIAARLIHLHAAMPD